VSDNKVMLDLETMGTCHDAAIVAVAAVRFTDTEIVDSFNVCVSLQSCVTAGMVIEPSTVIWWMRQSDEARGLLTGAAISLSACCELFAAWIGPNAEVWGNGADFDNAILATAYRFCGMKQPWQYTANRCYRTVKSWYPGIEFERLGTHHNALDDARSQALHLIKCMNQTDK
jgi:exodeoxyribonuclease VIII